VKINGFDKASIHRDTPTARRRIRLQSKSKANSEEEKEVLVHEGAGNEKGSMESSGPMTEKTNI